MKIARNFRTKSNAQLSQKTTVEKNPTVQVNRFSMGSSVSYCVDEILAPANESVFVPILTGLVLLSVFIVPPMCALLPLHRTPHLQRLQGAFLVFVQWCDFDSGTLPIALKLSGNRDAQVLHNNSNYQQQQPPPDLLDARRPYSLRDLRPTVRTVGGLVSILLTALSCYGIWFVLVAYRSPLTQEVLVTAAQNMVDGGSGSMHMRMDVRLPCSHSCSQIMTNVTLLSHLDLHTIASSASPVSSDYPVSSDSSASPVSPVSSDSSVSPAVPRTISSVAPVPHTVQCSFDALSKQCFMQHVFTLHFNSIQGLLNVSVWLCVYWLNVY